ncbi:SusC/RagA family TonB-linked outer membrane protein [Sphingobacterium kitahiroshimense]|uniref:SusC/RagA family TonB-linked outer membrane protein n=1 Tax=Sphingobacterium kitahiroshimense TaxID=470446 RepID=UPI00320821F8
MKIDNRYKTKDWRDLQKLGKYKGELLLLSKLLLLSLLMIFHMVSLYAQIPRKASGVNGQVKYELAGRVISSIDGTPMQGVSIRIDDENLQIRTSRNGTFELLVTNRKGKVKFSYVGFETQEINYTSGVSLVVKLIPEDNKLQEVEVVSTGYQKIPKERATGSFEFVDNKLFNRKVSTDFISRLEDIVPGISAPKVFAAGRGNYPNIYIRGASTMYSQRWPLIVIDGMPYQGDFNSINPNDIENISVLKDAAAASIWGAQAGNGVLVITTKKGGYSQPITVSFNSNLTIVQKPDLYYMPQMSAADYIEVEKTLYEKDHYKYRFNSIWNYFTPVVNLLKKRTDGLISDAELSRELDRLSHVDSRDDFTKYIYRKAFKQQYHLQLSGGNSKFSSLNAVGFDHNRNNVVFNDNERFNLRTSNSYKPTEKLDIQVSVQYIRSQNQKSDAPIEFNRMGLGFGNFPYMELADKNGNPLEVEALGMNKVFRDTVAGGRLLRWNYIPLAELDATSSKRSNNEAIIDLNMNYKLMDGLIASVVYNYRNGSANDEVWRSVESKTMREFINIYAGWDANQVTYPVPVGDYLQNFAETAQSHQGRFVLAFDKKWNDKHQFSGIAGSEIRQNQTQMRSSTFYGFNRENYSYKNVDHNRLYPSFQGQGGYLRIPDYGVISKLTNRFVSYYANGSYTYLNKYIWSGSVRKDASNLFGVNTNDKGQPFWSVGMAWILSNESLFGKQKNNYLKLRTTYGYNGNVNNSISALPILNVQSNVHPTTGNSYAVLQSPGNPDLRWERVATFNLGLDYGLFENRLSGSIEYYVKNSKDLITFSRIDPTSGYGNLFYNSANTKGKGIDASIRSLNVNSGKFKWISNFAFAYNRVKVTNSNVENTLGLDYIGGDHAAQMTPIQGADLFSLLSFKWAGLDPETGVARGYINGEVSKDYMSIYYNSTIHDLENHGSTVPLYFGSLRNTFEYGPLEFSFNISYQLGHYFMRTSYNNSRMVLDGVGHLDYAKRWRKPGDERTTDVPAFQYPINYVADYFYNFSSALVEPAGQIKLRDIQLSYNLSGLKKRFLNRASIYGYAANVMTLWRANKLDIDPEFGYNSPDPLAISFGINLKF